MMRRAVDRDLVKDTNPPNQCRELVSVGARRDVGEWRIIDATDTRLDTARNHASHLDPTWQSKGTRNVV